MNDDDIRLPDEIRLPGGEHVDVVEGSENTYQELVDALNECIGYIPRGGLHEEFYQKVHKLLKKVGAP